MAEVKPTAELATPAECVVRIDNNEIKYNISAIQLDQFIDNHHQLTVRIQQVGKAETDRDFDDPQKYLAFLGCSIALNITPTGGMVEGDRELEFIGVVTDVQIENSIDGMNIVLIHAASPTISMDGAPRNAHYFDKSVSDIIGSLVRNYPITVGTIESTSGKYKFITQYRESDYDYILGLAKGAGMFAYYNGRDFNLTKAGSSNTCDLVWRESLGSFKMGLGTAPVEFTSKVYNYEQKKIYTQDSKSLPQQAALSDISKKAPDASKKIYKESGYSTAPKTVADAQTLDKTLQNERSKAMGSMVRCVGKSIAPDVAVGSCIKIEGMDKLDGQYWVKGVRHILDDSGKYHNTFICSPLDISYPDDKPVEKDMSHEIGIIDSTNSTETVREVKKKEIVGLHVARVVDLNDPEKLGRIKISYPWLDSETTEWTRIAVPHAGPDRGWYTLPELEDEVLVGFEHGDTNHPVILGSLYNHDNKPMSEAVNDNNEIKMFMTRSGNKIVFNDADGSEQIVIANKDGKNQITLDMSGPSITIKSEGDITIEGQNIDLKASGGITMKADGDSKLQAVNVEFKAQANMKVEASANCDINGNAQVNVKGGMINLN